MTTEEIPLTDMCQSDWNLSEEEARDALIQSVDHRGSYLVRAARQMDIIDIQTKLAYHCTVETFTESRSTTHKQRAYSGPVVESVVNSSQDDTKWNLEVSVPCAFDDREEEIVFPDSVVIQECNNCLGRGKIECLSCRGTGKGVCVSCDGCGKEKLWEGSLKQLRSCVWCDSTGKRRCHRCKSRGKYACRNCKGHGKVQSYQCCLVKWRTVKDEHVTRIWDIPDHEHVLQNVSGIKVHDDVPRDSIDEIGSCFKRLLDGSSQFSKTGKILNQRQSCRAIPVARVCCRHKNHFFEFFVCGTDHKVYAPSSDVRLSPDCVVL